MMPMRHPARVPANGMVSNHPAKIQPVAFQLMAWILPLERPTPSVDPVMHIVVDTGRP